MRRFLFASCVILLLCGRAYPAELTQYFDSEGNLSTSTPLKPVAAAEGYIIPQGLSFESGVDYNFYPVFGKTFSQLVQSAEENGPYDRTRKRRSPSTMNWRTGLRYSVEYDHQRDEESGSIHAAIELKEIDLSFFISVTLPALIDNASLNPAERHLWKDYVGRLLEHEHDHVIIIKDRESRSELVKKLSEINYLIIEHAADTDIDGLIMRYINTETARIAKSWIRQIRQRSEEYDRTTDYGRQHDRRKAFFR